jgi:hypothetical protein
VSDIDRHTVLFHGLADLIYDRSSCSLDTQDLVDLCDMVGEGSGGLHARVAQHLLEAEALSENHVVLSFGLLAY